MRYLTACGAVLLLAGCLCGVWAATQPLEITITSRPSQPELNILGNGDFSAHEVDKPAVWAFGTAKPDIFTARWDADGHDAPGCVYVKSLSGGMSAYWSQSFENPPAGKRLMARCWLKLGGGRPMQYVVIDTRPADGAPYTQEERALIYSTRQSFLSPLYLKPEYLLGPDPRQWVLIQWVFDTTPGAKGLTYFIGPYFMAGEMWVDDCYLGPAQMDMTVAVRQLGAGPGDRIARVAVTTAADKPVYDSGPLEPVAEWKHTLAGLDCSGQPTGEATAVTTVDITARFKVTATTADGRTVTSDTYPMVTVPW